MALQYAMLYISVALLAFLSGYQSGIFGDLVAEVHNMDHWYLDPDTDDEDWDSDEDDDDDDDESDDEDHSSEAVRQQTGNSDKVISSK
ncbi:hypothetical protein H9Q72_007175 [Fusarium xylarioides]|uniref:Uncharacterized protein n=1 Tax=Fusarium xylarioides TaxID=221167 RepID=A0A9P7HRA4_9HYPO|nr:hypothetical protein H9Q72_007175 [Fusarium xylarioides]